MVLQNLEGNLNFNGLTVLYKIANLLLSGGEKIEDTMLAILKILESDAGMNRGAITILSPDNTELSVDVALGLDEEERKKVRYKYGEGITGKVVSSGRAIAVPVIGSEPAFLNRTGMRKKLDVSALSFLCVPIKKDEMVIGALSVDRVAIEDKLTLEGELKFLEAVANLIANAVENRRKHYREIYQLEKENLELRKNLEIMGKPEYIIGNSSLMKEVYRQIAQVAPSNANVLILGETGTGKELIARAIHQKSLYSKGNFVAVNCAALPETLIESELFGHEKGSFTGAIYKRIGKFEEADNGTIFLDEIGEMSLPAQARLLRVIQEKGFQRIGGNEYIKVNVRLICATNRNLEKEIKEGRFREDLYYRINVFTIYLPPLRERGADILLLADYFVKKYSNLHSKKIERISTPAIELLSSYHWPGNVRELENVIERAVLVTTGNVIDAHHLPPTLQIKENFLKGKRVDTFENMVAAYERELIIEALKDARGNQSEAARILGTTKRIIQYKINKLNIDFRRYRGLYS